MPFTTKRLIAPVAFVTLLTGALGVGSATAASFTAEQSAAGQTSYNSQCAQCHGRQLEGPEAPGLAGSDVMQNWDTVGGLYDFISVAMPPSAPGQLGEDTYVNIIAYIMQFNGATPGDTPLTSDRDYLVSLAAETAAGAASMAAAAADAGGAATSTAPAATTAVPQAYTWGKQLPGGPAPTTMAPATPAPASTVPQAFTWGTKIPTVGN
ncbi:c-type cytochrome [Devosia sp. 2618]|uniref:c-type cytochrome n=1 Tax=Devosia sp. 2618 TaxID=3156454 RepID=UPI0033969808